MKTLRDKMCESIGVDINDPSLDVFDLKMFDDMAMLQMLIKRALSELADEPATAMEVVAGYVEDQPFYKLQTNPRIKVVAELTKLQNKLMDSMLTTRKAKFQSEGSVADPSKRAADLANKVRLLETEKRARMEEDANIIDAEVVAREEDAE